MAARNSKPQQPASTANQVFHRIFFQKIMSYLKKQQKLQNFLLTYM
jgi:hypothetical protein